MSERSDDVRATLKRKKRDDDVAQANEMQKSTDWHTPAESPHEGGTSGNAVPRVDGVALDDR